MMYQMIALTRAARMGSDAEPAERRAVLVGDHQPHLVDAEPGGGHVEEQPGPGAGGEVEDVGVGDLEGPVGRGLDPDGHRLVEPVDDGGPSVPSSLERVTEGGATTSMPASWSSR